VFGRATIRLGIGPHSSVLKALVQVRLQACELKNLKIGNVLCNVYKLFKKNCHVLAFFMAALRSRCGHNTFDLWLTCGFFFLLLLLLLLLAYSQPSQIGCLPYLYTWCGLSVNLERRSEVCCARLVKIQDAKKCPKIRHLRTITQLCWAVSSQPNLYRQSEKNC